MDRVVPGDTNSEVDLESGVGASSVGESSRSPSGGENAQHKTMLSRIYSVFSEGMIKGEEEEEVSLMSNMPNPSFVAGDCVKLERGEKIVVDQKKVVVQGNHKKKSNPKPPRPPRSPSLDAADEKLIKEISELAMLKRARIERMKALKRIKAAKTSASSSPSNTNNVFAALFTILFCLVILFQGN